MRRRPSLTGRRSKAHRLATAEQAAGSEFVTTSIVAGGGFRHAVDALRYRVFATFWTGALISNCGVWMQNVTVPYVIFRSTGSAALVGVTAFSQFIPALFFGPIGGWLADRYARRTVLLVTQAIQAALAVVLWAAYASGLHHPAVLISIVFATGVVQGLNVPAWQAFVGELVPRRALLNALTLNSAQFNAARAVGPAIGGVVLAKLGASWAFMFNAISYGAVIAALFAIPSKIGVAPEHRSRQRLLPQIRESLRYARATRGIFVAVSLLAVGAGLGQPVFQLIPVFAEEVYNVEAWRYGLMAASLGCGGVLGAALLGGIGGRTSRSAIVKTSITAYGVALIVFGMSSVYLLGVAALMVAGAFYIAVQALLNTSVQVQVSDRLRGGVLAVYVMTFNLAYPVGALLQGVIAELVGPRWTVIGSSSLIVSAAFLARGRHAFEALDAELEEFAPPADASGQEAGSTSE